jgi:hypothetical protein
VWVPVLAGSAAAFGLKAVGFVLPRGWLEHRLVTRAAAVMPVALLAALVLVQAFTDHRRLVVDARAGGLAVALVLLVVRAPFLVVIAAPVVTTALLRAVGVG